MPQVEFLLLAAVGAAIPLALVLYRPFYALLFAISAGQLDFLIAEQYSGFLSIGRVAGLMVMAGWFFRSVIGRQSHFLFHARLNLAALGFLAVVLVGSIAAYSPPDALYAFLRFFLLFALLVFTEDLVRTRAQLIFLTLTIALAYGLSSITGILQLEQLQSGYDVDEVIGYATVGDSLRLGGMHENPNEYAIMLMSGVPFLVLWLRASRSWLLKALCLVLLAMCAYSLILTGARTHVVAAAAFIVAYLGCRIWYRVWEKVDVVFVICLALLMLSLIGAAPDAATNRLTETQDDSALMRIELMKKGMALFAENPIVGIGADNLKFHPPLEGMGGHDTFAFMFGETGTLGVLMVVAMCLVTFKNQLRMRRVLLQSNDRWLLEIGIAVQAAFFALLVASFGNIIPYQRMFWIYMGLSALLAHGGAHGFWQESRRTVVREEPAAHGLALRRSAD